MFLQSHSSFRFNPFITIVYCLFLQSQGFCQEGLNDSIQKTSKAILYSVSSGALLSTDDNTPFWLRANQFGMVAPQSPAILLTGSISSDYRDKKWDWGFGVEAFSTLGRTNQINLPEGYVKGKWGVLEVWGGRRKQIVGLVGDSTLTSGSYVESGNTIPIPRIQIGFQEYVPFLKGLFAIKGFLAHGWFDANPIVKNHWLHQKTLYGRFGKENWKIRVYGGLNHNVQWGGKILTPNRWTVGNQNPSDWIDYWYVISSKRIPTFGYVDPTKYDAIDRGNRIGNHLGSVDLGFEWKFKDSKLIFYRQSFYDDGSLFNAANLADGLHGISWKNTKANSHNSILKGVTIEFLNSSNQGGDIFSLDGGPRGRDDYFNHLQFWGWAYGRSTIGTPFINPSTESRINLRTNAFTNNNRVRLIHVGGNGKIRTINYLIKASFSHNLGTYNIPFNPQANQFSTIIDLSKSYQGPKLGKYHGFLKIAADLGQLYPNNIGVYFGVRKNGQFAKR